MPDTADPGGTTRSRERREAVRAQVLEAGFARIDTLASAFDVSPMTIHRDLDELQRQGWLRKVRGGATSEPSVTHHGDIRHREQTMAPAKDALAATAARTLTSGQTILLDESTTSLALARRLPAGLPLTVVTNFLPIVNLLKGRPEIDLISLGGNYFPAYDAFLGTATCDALRALHTDVLFMSTTAISGLSCFQQSQETVAVNRAMIDAARRRVLLVDHTKFERSGTHRLAGLADYELVVVDHDLPAATLEGLRAAKIPVEVAEAASTA